MSRKHRIPFTLANRVARRAAGAGCNGASQQDSASPLPAGATPARRLAIPTAALLALWGAFAGADLSRGEEPKPTGEPAQTTPAAADSAWQPLFDGKSLGAWKSTNFGGEGEVYVKDGALWLDAGSPLTGAHYTKPVPKLDYECRLEATPAKGSDFFCGLTFPVGDAPCSFIVGGWGGAVVGLSSIDDRDASENETTRVMSFKEGQWYKIRVRVTAKRVLAWIDDEQVVNQVIEGRRVGIRPEVEKSKPFGLASYQTLAGLRKIELRKLTADEVAKANNVPKTP